MKRVNGRLVLCPVLMYVYNTTTTEGTMSDRDRAIEDAALVFAAWLESVESHVSSVEVAA